MARKWGRIVSITALVVVVITGIVVGVLFAVGVLHIHKSGSSPTPPTPPTPKPTPYPPFVNCDQMPTVTSFNRILDGTYRMTFDPPIGPNCIQAKDWMYVYSMTVTDGRTGESLVSFRPIPGQSFVDINLDLPFNDPHSPIKSATGQVWLRTVNSNGTGGLQESNKLPYVITNI